MAFLQTLKYYLSGAAYRQAGQQAGNPAYYSSKAATPVTVDSALQLSAVWACIKLIAETVGALPINVYRVNPATGERKLDNTHWLAVLLAGKVNRWQTRQEFMECMTYQLALLGNNYAVKQYSADKKSIISLIPLMTPQMEVFLERTGAITYRYQETEGLRVYAEQSIWQNKIFGNGIVGLSPLSYARNSIGIAQAAEASVSKIYQNGGKPSGVLMIDKIMTADQRKQVKENFAEMAEGNEDRLFVLEAGMKYEQLSLSPQDIELLESRRFQIEDIARFFGVPSVLINDASQSTAWGSGIQQIVSGWYRLGLRPYLERYEASIKANLLGPDERLTIDVEFDFNALLQADFAERIKTYKDGIQGGVMTPNQARTQEGWSQEPGGDKLLVQQQMVALDQLDKVARPAIGGNSNATNQQ